MSVTVILTVLLPSMSSGRKSSSSIRSVEVMEMPSTSWNYKKIILMIKTRIPPSPPDVHTFKKCHHLTESCWHQITTKKECHKVSCLFSKRIQRDYWKSNSLHLKGTCAVNAWIFFNLPCMLLHVMMQVAAFPCKFSGTSHLFQRHHSLQSSSQHCPQISILLLYQMGL